MIKSIYYRSSTHAAFPISVLLTCGRCKSAALDFEFRLTFFEIHKVMTFSDLLPELSLL